MSTWRILWADLFGQEEPDAAVAASMDEIERHCAPFTDDPFLIIAMFQHRHGQAVDLSIEEWLERHGETLRAYLRDANTAAMKLYVAAGTANTAARKFESLSQEVSKRVTRSLLAVEHAERGMRDQASENRAAYRAIREHLSWTRPTFLIVLALGLAASIMVNGFLARQAFAIRPSSSLWTLLSDAERRELPDFVASGALSDVMDCRVADFRIEQGRCIPNVGHGEHGSRGWALPDEVVRRRTQRWSSER